MREREATLDLTESFRSGMIDTGGPVIDLGEPQSIPSLRTSTPIPSETVNGSSWARVGARLRLRVVLDPTRGPEEPPSQPPNAVRIRIRHATSRQLAVIVDGLLVRAALLPQGGEANVLSLSVPPDRFRRSVAEVELRFSASRAVRQAGAPVASVDWVHFAREDALPARCADLVNDVAVERAPRRALTFYAPTALSTTVVVPERAVWKLALAAEAPHGGARAPRPVVARIRVESDGVAPVDRSVTVRPNTPWQALELDLSQFAGRASRLELRASRPEGMDPEELHDVRLAVASPRLERSAPLSPQVTPRVRHVVMVVLRGARIDRFLPTLSPRFTGGLATMVRGGVLAEATAGSYGAWAATQTATTGLTADRHGVREHTDLLSDEAPTPATVFAEHGIASAAYSDDAVWIGSGADRGYNRREGCPEAQPLCRVAPMFQAIADSMTTRRGPSFTLVVTRAGTIPLDPPNDLVLALDPVPYEGTITPAQTGVLAARTRYGELRLDPRDRARLDLLYDAALLQVDRGLTVLIERLQNLRLDDSTLLLVVGDRGTALASGRHLGDGPMSRREVASTVLLARGPGLPRGVVLRGVTGTLDAVATALDAFGIALPPEYEGVSLYDAERLAERALPFVANARGDLGLRFGAWTALPRPPPLQGMSLYSAAEDPLGVDDVGDAHPIARGFAEGVIALVRGDASRRVFARSTRVLTPPPSR